MQGLKHSLHMVTSCPRSNRNISCCPVMFLHDNDTVPLVTDLPFPVKTVTVQRHVLLYQMYRCCGYLVTVRRVGVDSVQTWQAGISHHYNNGQCNGVCRICYGNCLLLSSHSQYKFLKNVQTFLNNPYIQGVPGGKYLNSGECSLGQTIPI